MISPAAEVKTSENPFNLLDQQDEEALDDTEAADNQSKRPSEDQSVKSWNKSTKKNKKIDSIDDFHDVCDEYGKLPAPEYAYSVRNTKDGNEAELLRCNESMSSDSNESESSEEGEEHPDDYHKMDEMAMHTIRCADDIYKFHHATQNDGSFLYDDRIQYRIDLNKRKIRQAFESIYNDGMTYKLHQLTNKARSLPKIYDMVYPAMLNELFNPPQGFKFQYKNKPIFDDETEQWNSNDKKKKEEMNGEKSSYVLYKVTRDGMLDSYKGHYDLTEETLDK